MLQQDQCCVTSLVHKETNCADRDIGQLRNNRCEIDVHLAFPVGEFSQEDGMIIEFGDGVEEARTER